MEGEGGREKEEEQDGVSEQQQVEVELRLLVALAFYPPVKLQGMHRHFVLYGLMEFLRRSLDRHFSPDEVVQLLDRFYNLEVLKPDTDDEEVDILNHEEDFCLAQSYFVKEEP
ncbi:hypothetical protein DITRI_Ditri12bG0008800 [Diplodiscus trichospermus]